MAIGKVTLLDVIASYTGQPVALFCGQLWYRGVLKDMGTDYVVLDPAWAVEKPGGADAEKADVEYRVPSAVVVSGRAIQLVCQPKWAFYGLQPKK